MIAGIYVNLFCGLQNIILRQRGGEGRELSQGRLQHFVQVAFTRILPSLCVGDDPGEEADETVECAWASVVSVDLLAPQSFSSTGNTYQLARYSRFVVVV